MKSGSSLTTLPAQTEQVPTTSKRLAQHEVYMSHCATPFFATLYAAQGHSKPVDWWAYGVLLYEMIAGYVMPPVTPLCLCVE